MLGLGAWRAAGLNNVTRESTNANLGLQFLVPPGANRSEVIFSLVVRGYDDYTRSTAGGRVYLTRGTWRRGKGERGRSRERKRRGREEERGRGEGGRGGKGKEGDGREEEGKEERMRGEEERGGREMGEWKRVGRKRRRG